MIPSCRFIMILEVLLICILIPTSRHVIFTAATDDWEGLSGSFILLDGNEKIMANLIMRNNEKIIVVEGVGSMWGYERENPVQQSCTNASYSFRNETKRSLVEFIEEVDFKKQIKKVYIGLLTIDQNAVMEWNSACRDQYIKMQVTVAKEIHRMLSNYSSLVHFYIPQEPDLNAMVVTPSTCHEDGEMLYLQTLSNSIKKEFNDNPNIEILISPYFMTDLTPEQIASIHTSILICCPAISASAPQDGVGSFGYSPQTSAIYFKAMRESLVREENNMSSGTLKSMGSVPLVSKLWANIETFLPKAKICEKAPNDRVLEQIQSVRDFVSETIHFWAYNLPSAPPCPYHYFGSNGQSD